MAFDRWLVFSVFSALFLFVAGALAEPSEADQEMARDLMKRGRAAERAGKWSQALDAYRGADEIMGVPSTRFSVCRAQVKLGKLLEARSTCLSVRNIPKAEPESKPFIVAREEAASLAVSLKARIGSIRVRLAGAPPSDLSIQIDGEEVPTKVLDVGRPANPGAHEVTVGAKGHAATTVKVELAEGEHTVVDVELTVGDPGVAGQPPGAPDASTDPPVDGPGEHDGVHRDGAIHPLVWAGIAIGGAGIVVGAIAGGVAASQAGAVSDRCADDVCDENDTALRGDYDAALTTAHISTVGFVVGGAGVGLLIIGLLLPSDGDAAPTEARVRPALLPFGFGMEARF